MNIEQVRDYCILKKQVEECFPFDETTLVFKVMGKSFLFTDINEKPIKINLKCHPEKVITLREKYSQVTPGYHMNKKHWNTVLCDGSLPLKLIYEWIDHSYEMVVNGLTKKQQAELKRK